MKKLFTLALAGAACFAASATVPTTGDFADYEVVAEVTAQDLADNPSSGFVMATNPFTGASLGCVKLGDGVASGWNLSDIKAEELTAGEYAFAYFINNYNASAKITVAYFPKEGGQVNIECNVVNANVWKIGTPFAIETDTNGAYFLLDQQGGEVVAIYGYALLKKKAVEPEPEPLTAANLDEAIGNYGEEYTFTGNLRVIGVSNNIVFVYDGEEYGQLALNGNRAMLNRGDILAGGWQATTEIVGEEMDAFPRIVVEADQNLAILAEDGEPALPEIVEAEDFAEYPYAYFSFDNLLVTKVVETVGEDEEGEPIVETTYYIQNPFNQARPMTLDEDGEEGPDMPTVDGETMAVYFLNDAEIENTTEGEYRYDVAGILAPTEDGVAFFAGRLDGVLSPATFLVAEGLESTDEANTFEFENSVTCEIEVVRPRALGDLEQVEIFYCTGNRIAPMVEYTEPFTVSETTNVYSCSKAFMCPESEVQTISLIKKVPTQTGIDAIAADQNVKVYNLQGVQVSAENLPAGLYIVNGKKVIVRK